MSAFPLVHPLFSGFVWRPDQVLTYGFAPEGSAVDKGGYRGGSDFADAWTAAGMDLTRSIFAQLASFTALRVGEATPHTDADIRLTTVSAVPGGWAGYAGYPDPGYWSDLTIGNDYVRADDYTLVHEIGHALGLRHPHERPGRYPGVSNENDLGDFGLNNAITTVMTYNYPVSNMHNGMEVAGDITSYMAADIAALQEMYGVNTTFAQVNDVYRNQAALICIWDTGGVDTINFSGAVRATVIDLRTATLQNDDGGGGYLSFIRNGQTAIGGYTIAKGVVIENAVGSIWSDRITGNDADNRLNGLEGQDRLDGHGGDDLLIGGAGRDTFVFNGGADWVNYFRNDVDTIEVGGGLAADYGSARALLNDLAYESGRHVVIDFGGDDWLVVRNVRSVAALYDDLTLA